MLAILKKARSSFIKIIKKPIEFVGYLIDAVANGFRQFSGNILNHLRAGLIGWLTGTLGSAGIQLPERFDLKGIVSLVLQILGLTWPRIRQKLVRHLGERAGSFLETAFEIVRLLVTEGPGALWEKLIEYIGNLKDTIMESIRNWIIEKVVTLAVTNLASLLTPAGAVIQAIISIYNTIIFFIERINQILDLVESVVNSVARIADGKIQEAADFVEQSMASTIPVIISFLSRIIGLGDIGQKIQNVIKNVQAKVDNGVDRVVVWIVARGRSMMNRLCWSGGAEADAVWDYQSILRERVPFSMSSRQHYLIFRNKGNGVEIYMSSPDANYLNQKITTAKQGLGDREELTQAQRTTISTKLDEFNDRARLLNAPLGMMRNPNLASNPGVFNAFKNSLTQAGGSVQDPTDVAAVRTAVLANVQALATAIQTFGTTHNLTDLMFLDVQSAELEVGTYTDLLRVNSYYNDTQTDTRYPMVRSR